MPELPKPSRKAAEKALGYRFGNKTLLDQALTHPSFGHEGGAPGDDNQRLEFLGDAVIGLLAAEWLFGNLPEHGEGNMTKLRSALTNRAGLAEIARRWDLGGAYQMGRGERKSGGVERESNLADFTEALVGAVYLDGGMRAARKLFLRHFAGPLQAVIRSGPDADNPKGALQEAVQQRHKLSPVYQIVAEDGPAHDRRYRAQVQVGEQVLGEGSGSSKRLAEAEAARAALHTIRRQGDQAAEPSPGDPDASAPVQ